MAVSLNPRSNLKEFDAVIFDMDGLLIDSEKIAFEAFAEVCARFALGDQSALFYKCIGTNRAAGEQLIKDGLEDKVDYIEFIAAWDALYISRTTNTKIPLKAGAQELLEHITSLEVPIGVATSSSTRRATQKLQDGGIFHYFKTIVGGEQVVKSKPNPDIFLRAAAVLGARAEKCLALEDSENGVTAAVSAGMVTIQIPDLVEPSNELKALGHIILPSLAHVKAYEFRSG
jgi:HAD superfamily hydrolase (TIGR01509 family)